MSNRLHKIGKKTDYKKQAKNTPPCWKYVFCLLVDYINY